MLSQDAKRICLLSLIAGALSLIATGHISGINNNLFNYITIGRLFDLPQFRNDAPVQSMRYYASGFWLPFIGWGRWVSPDIFFLIWAWIARVVLCWSLLLWADLVGIKRTTSRAAFLGIVLLSRYMQGFSYAGDGDLLTNYFSHTDVANGTMLLALYFVARGRLTAACVANGITFFTNAFMAIWVAVPFALILAWRLRTRRDDLSSVVRQMAMGLAGFIVLACPVLWVTFTNPEAHTQAGFAFRPYLLEYFPGHFLIGTTDGSAIRHLVALFVAGLAAAWAIRRRSPAPLLALSGFGILWILGTILPSMTDRPAVFVLHLLRSGVGIHLMAGIAIGLFAVSLLEQRTSATMLASAALVAACILPARGPLPLAIVSIAALSVDHWPNWKALRAIAVALILGAVTKESILLAHGWKANRHIRERVAEWRELAQWARTQTAPGATFLLPTSPIFHGPSAPPVADAGAEQTAVGDEGFEYYGQRRVWVDYKRGGVIMWAPDYYPVWKQRVEAILPLPDAASRIAFARSHGINYVADRCSDGLPAVARTRDICIYSGAV
jgi:hypothetical protein